MDRHLMKYLVAALAFSVTLSACATTAAVPIVDGGQVRTDGMVQIDEPVRVGAVVVTPKRVLEDSRCPANVQCIWAGRVVLETVISGSGWRETANLELGKEYRSQGTALALVKVSPDKVTGNALAPADYLFEFERR